MSDVWIGAITTICVAAAGAASTIYVSRKQARSRERELRALRYDQEESRRRVDEQAVFLQRAEVIEGIASAIADCIEQTTERGIPASDSRVRAELVKLTTRCDAEHLSRHCANYLADARKSPHVADYLEALDDIQRRLEGWHLGHLSVAQVDAYMDEGREAVRRSLREHGVEFV
ncbi:hypothetical protein ACFQ9V_13200 [Leifsonia sp. NPDC056665]|uniref:hypothetical protein n=1 Tax=Leifsonia sp. NPDC056665 TaxID=3345901 RepID=UPI0036BED9D8